MNGKVKVKINKTGFIPGIGNGPVLTPIWIPVKQYELLKKLGYDIEVITEPSAIDGVKVIIPAKEEEPEVDMNELNKVKAPTIDITAPESEEVVEEAVTLEEPEVVEETVEVVEILEDDEELSGEAFYTMDFLTGKKAEAILENRGVDFSECKNATDKKELVLETNPEVE